MQLYGRVKCITYVRHFLRKGDIVMKKYSAIISIVLCITLLTSGVMFCDGFKAPDSGMYALLNVLKSKMVKASDYDEELPIKSFCEPDESISALENLVKMDIAQGYDDGKLHPELSITRAQFAKFLFNTFGYAVNDYGEYTKFSDLDKSHWSYEFVVKAVESGWLNGFPDGTFRPDDNITYEQALAVVCRILNIDDYNCIYPQGYVSAAIDNSITDKVNAFIGDTINREQAARIIVNAMEYVLRDTEDDDYSYKGSSGGGGSASLNHLMVSSPAISDRAVPESYEVASDAAYAYEMPASPDVFPAGQFNTEEYSHNEENVFKDPVTSPLSTFSIDTDTASYSNMRRYILDMKKNIPGGAVRVEELINYFDYSKAECTDGLPFGVKSVVSVCPWNTDHNLAMLTVSGDELKEKMPSNIVFLVDISGSMYDRNKLPLVKSSLKLLLEKLDETDRISIVTYASGTGVALESTPATEKEKIMSTIDSLSAGGGTYGAAGIQLAYEQAEKHKIDGNNRIILCTDGDFNIGQSSETELENLISEKRESGIFLSVLGFGMGNYKDNKMEILADKGNGNYAYIDNLREAKKVLVDDMSKTIYTIAKDVKLQVEFNPEKVGAYRLVGYENRMLNNEDFDNDKKDAGELGAGATVTVLYEIVPREGEITSSLKYQNLSSNGSNELMNVKIRYKEPDGDVSKLIEFPVENNINSTPGEDFNFACAVTQFGMIVNKSEYMGTSTVDSVMELAKNSCGADEFGLRHEFVQLVDLYRYTEK